MNHQETDTKPFVLVIVIVILLGVIIAGVWGVRLAVRSVKEAAQQKRIDVILKEIGAAFERQEDEQAAEKGRAFLVGLFDPSLGLLPEYRGSSVYWLYHDNYLAAKVFEKSHADLAQKIRAAIESNGVRESGKIEIVFGEAKRPLPFRQYQLQEVRQVGGKVIKTEVVTDTEMSGWEEYADLLFLASMAEGDPAKAREYLQRGLAMWDGEGFNDRVAQKRHIYSTYKLALALIAADGLGDAADPAIVEKLLAQQAEDGGWITDYDPNGRPKGKANVETTSLAILAMEAAAKRLAAKREGAVQIQILPHAHDGNARAADEPVHSH